MENREKEKAEKMPRGRRKILGNTNMICVKVSTLASAVIKHSKSVIAAIYTCICGHLKIAAPD